MEGEAATLDLAGRFRDPEGGALTLTAASSDEAVATATLADSVVTIAPVAPGRVTVSVTARDEGGRAAYPAGGRDRVPGQPPAGGPRPWPTARSASTGRPGWSCRTPSPTRTKQTC